MYFAARSALLASCLAITVQALPVTYSVVDVDGGSAANDASDQPETIYQTVTKSTEVEEPEATTVSVSITIVETKHASMTSADVSSSPSSLSTSTSSSTSSPASSLNASAQASSSPPVPSATATSTQDAASVLQSVSSTFSARTTSKSSSSATPTITQAPSAESASYGSQTTSSEECECEAPSVTVTADVTDAEETVTATKGETVVILSTTTVTPTASSTSYYDDGMWHTRYAVKPSASPEAEKPASEEDDAAPKFNEKKQAGVAANTTSQTPNDTYRARREVDIVAATPTVPAAPSGKEAEASGAPLMFVQPLFARVTGLAARAVPTGGVAAPSDVLSADVVPTTEQFARRASTYSVVSWNETLQG
jgi:hypothetical protein